MTKSEILKAITTADTVYAGIKVTAENTHYMTLTKNAAAKIIRLTPCEGDDEYLATYNPGPNTNALWLN